MVLFALQDKSQFCCVGMACGLWSQACRFRGRLHRPVQLWEPGAVCRYESGGRTLWPGGPAAAVDLGEVEQERHVQARDVLLGSCVRPFLVCSCLDVSC